MSDHDSLIDPEAEAILLEVAKDPDSVLLKAERPKKLSRVVAQGGDLLVTHKTGLTSAEKKLLDVYREEAAYLLRLAYFELFEGAGTDHSLGLMYTPQGLNRKEVGVSKLARRLTENSQQAGDEIDVSTAVRLIRGPKPQWIRIAQASLKFAPSLAAESYVGRELMIAGELEEAEAHLLSALKRPMSRELRASLLATLGTIRCQAGNRHGGRDSYRRAAMMNPKSAAASFSWLWRAACAEDHDEAVRAAHQVDLHWPQPCTELRAWLGTMRAQRSLQEQALIQAVPRFFTKLKGGLGPSSAMIVEAIQR